MELNKTTERITQNETCPVVVNIVTVKCVDNGMGNVLEGIDFM